MTLQGYQVIHKRVATLQTFDFLNFNVLSFCKKSRKYTLPMLDLKRPKRYLSFLKKSNLNIAPSYEEKFGIKKNGEPSQTT